MEEKNRHRLDEALANLPQHEPDAAAWNKIEAFLDFEDRLQQIVPELPEHEPSDFLWSRIEENLPAQTGQELPLPIAETAQKQTKVFSLYRYAAAIAASVVLLLVGVYFFRNPELKNKAASVHIAYSEEVLTVPEPAIPAIADFLEAEHEGLAFIEQHCTQLPETCQTPEFKELKTQLAELEKENEQLKRDLALYGEDPMLVQSQIKVENLKAQVTKELIQLIVS